MKIHEVENMNCVTCFYNSFNSCLHPIQDVIRYPVDKNSVCGAWRCDKCLRSIEESILTDIRGERVFLNHRICEKIKVL